MAEYIEREAAVMKIREWFWSAPGVHPKLDRDMAEDILFAIPAADVRPVVRGKWTLNKDGSGTCSECGRVQTSCWDIDNWDNFCHHCGADMREMDDG